MKSRKLLALLVAGLMVMPSAAFSASENSVDRNLSVGADYTFTPTKAFSRLRIQENSPNEFATPSTIILKLNRAEWFETGSPAADPAGPDRIQADIQTDGMTGSSATVTRLSSKEIQVVLTRGVGSPTLEAWWSIPIYAEVKEAGAVEVTVDGRDSYVSSGTYTVAQAIGSDSGGIRVGHVYTASDANWITVREPEPNALAAGPQTFRLELTNAAWPTDPESIRKDSIVSGIEGASIKAVKRVSDTVLDVTVDRGSIGSVKGNAVWSVPLYCQVTGVGEIKISFKALESVFSGGNVTPRSAAEPIRTRVQLLLTLNSTALKVTAGGSEKTAVLSAAPLNPNGNTLVPVRGIYENLGATVSWNEQTRTAEIVQGAQRIRIPIGNTAIEVNGKPAILPEAARIINGRTYLPLRAISEQLGLDVQWNAVNQQITIIQQ